MRDAVILFLSMIAWRVVAITKPQLPLVQECISLGEAVATAKTGDIVLFISNRGRSSLMFRGYLALNPYTHVATVVVGKDGTPYCVEAHNDRSGPLGSEKKGVHVYSLFSRLRDTGRTCFVVKLESGKDVSENISDNVLRHWVPIWKKNIEYNTNFVWDEFMCHVFGFKTDVMTSRKMHCANFSAMILKAIGVAPPSAKIDCIRPIDVVSSLPLVPPYAYRVIRRVCR
jgi:hypothetical protein